MSETEQAAVGIKVDEIAKSLRRAQVCSIVGGGLNWKRAQESLAHAREIYHQLEKYNPNTCVLCSLLEPNRSSAPEPTELRVFLGNAKQILLALEAIYAYHYRQEDRAIHLMKEALVDAPHDNIWQEWLPIFQGEVSESYEDRLKKDLERLYATGQGEALGDVMTEYRGSISQAESHLSDATMGPGGRPATDSGRTVAIWGAREEARRARALFDCLSRFDQKTEVSVESFSGKSRFVLELGQIRNQLPRLLAVEAELAFIAQDRTQAITLMGQAVAAGGNGEYMKRLEILRNTPLPAPVRQISAPDSRTRLGVIKFIQSTFGAWWFALGTVMSTLSTISIIQRLFDVSIAPVLTSLLNIYKWPAYFLIEKILSFLPYDLLSNHSPSVIPTWYKDLVIIGFVIGSVYFRCLKKIDGESFKKDPAWILLSAVLSLTIVSVLSLTLLALLFPLYVFGYRSEIDALRKKSRKDDRIPMFVVRARELNYLTSKVYRAYLIVMTLLSATFFGANAFLLR
jgi:hypothetical protein